MVNITLKFDKGLIRAAYYLMVGSELTEEIMEKINGNEITMSEITDDENKEQIMMMAMLFVGLSIQ